MVIYEWSYEITDEFGDIIDSGFADKLKDLPEPVSCLVRNTGDEANGLTDREWAYVVDGKLEEEFKDAGGALTGNKVPKKYLNEFYK